LKELINLCSTIVKNFSFKKDENLHIIPGLENVNIFGVEIPNTNISDFYNFSCVNKVELNYVANNGDPIYEIVLNIAPEEIYFLLEKYPDIKNCEISYNTNNDDLFMIYGITLQSAEFDFAVFDYKVIFENLSNEDLKVINNILLILS